MERIGEHVLDLEAENALLKQHLVRSLVDITRRVEPEFFHWILVILAKGSVSGAAKSLNLKNSTFDEQLKQYMKKDRVHQTLYSLVTVRRKGLGRKSIEGFNEVFLGHQRPGPNDADELLRQVLDGLEALDPKNFKPMVNELTTLLREHLPET